MQKRGSKAKTAIITRTKNRNLLLERVLKSVDSQTSKDFVHVVLNDGGDKQSLEALLKKYPADNRVVIHNKTSVGLTPALNQAIRAVDSTYIAILDDDDSWAPERIEVVTAFMEDNGSRGSVVVMDRIVEEINDAGTKVRELSRNRWLEGIYSVSLYAQCLDNYLSNGSFTYTREVYKELGGYDEQLGVAEDWDFGIRYLLKYEAEFINTKEPLTFYHHRPQQTGDTGNSVFASVDTHAKNLSYLRNHYLRKDLQAGTFGIGYIMNDLAYRRAEGIEHDKKALANVVRLEGHINHVSAESTKDIEQVIMKHGLVQQIKRAVRR